MFSQERGGGGGRIFISVPDPLGFVTFGFPDSDPLKLFTDLDPAYSSEYVNNRKLLRRTSYQ